MTMLLKCELFLLFLEFITYEAFSTAISSCTIRLRHPSHRPYPLPTTDVQKYVIRLDCPYLSHLSTVAQANRSSLWGASLATFSLQRQRRTGARGVPNLLTLVYMRAAIGSAFSTGTQVLMPKDIPACGSESL